ncbi:iron transporter [Methylobacterium sp. NMS14P]|uniref:iron transporter n=1 Tax=Methylobacterium sp. NMS14P TaxID=2894310 RepID=UPI00235856C5|nr:iron transporter [Methylobacterium sp. NMS14P]WCS27904.1 iron transporter [Methylobacterium sp. NMS14P]
MARTRLAVAARIALAVFAGYGLAGLATAALALGLPMSRADAASTATMLSFAVYAAAVLWTFGARRLATAALGLLLPALALGGLVWALHGGAG